MISWHIEVNDKTSKQYYFPDFQYQELLLPYFGTGKIEIDEYGRTEYQGEELERLVTRLKHSYDYFEAKTIQWEIVETEFIGEIRNDSRPVSIRKFFKRQVVLQLLDNIIQMGTNAQSVNGMLVFLGD